MCGAVLLGITVIYSLRYGITPTPTSRRVRKTLFSLLPLIDKGIIVELGSGWGFVAFALARHYPTCQVIAYEISPVPYYFSKGIAFFYPLPNLTITRKDFFLASFRLVSLAVCYLYPGAMEQLKTKFRNELPEGAWVLTHTFALPGSKPHSLKYATDLYNTPVYLYARVWVQSPVLWGGRK